MPLVTEELPEIFETITRPVVFNIIDQLQLATSIDRKIKIIFPGQVEISHQVGSALQDVPETESNTFPSQGLLQVEIEDNYIEDNVLSTATTRKENPVIFSDPALGVDIWPIYTRNELVMNFTYRAVNETMMRRFRDDLKMRRSMGRSGLLHEVGYSYGIPLPFFPLLGQIHTQREAVAPYNQAFGAWFHQHVTARLAVVTNQAGNQPSVVIREQQITVTGAFDHLITTDEAERPGLQAGTGAMEVRFTYRVQYDRPMACALRYPISIHNVQLPACYLTKNNQYSPNQRLRAPSVSRRLFDLFTRSYPPGNPQYPYTVPGIDGVQSPAYDDWRPAHVYPDTSSLITQLIQVDLNTPTDVVVLSNLGEYAIDPDILAFMKDEVPFLTRYRTSIINLSLYEGRDKLPPTALQVDDHLQVTSTFAMDPRKVYHLRIALVNDLLTLPCEVQDRIRYAPAACLKILATLEANLPGGIQLPTPIDNLLISRVDFLAAGQRINSQKVPLKSSVEYVFMASVGNFTVAAAKEH